MEQAPLDPETGAPPVAEQTLIIIGNGMMCWKLCQKLVESGAQKLLEIVVFGEEPRPAYDRVHLTELFSGKTADDLTLAPAEWYAAHGIALYLGDPIVEINTDDCFIRSASGLEVPYDRLVFATGSKPFVPPIPGVDLPGVFVYRTVEHLEAIMEYGRAVKRAAVIGGGLLGLEAAKAAYDLGLEVHVVEFAQGLMPRQLDAAGAGLLKEKIEELGVRVHLGKQTTRIEDAPPSEHAPEMGERILHFADGGKLVVDMVLISAGIRPRGELAGAAGLALAKNGGIVVDDHLTTSDPRIFAIGECAVHNGVTYGLALPGYKMVDNLVDNLVGGTATFQGADVSARLKLMGVTVASLGQHNETVVPNATVNSFLAHGVYRKVVMLDGHIVGAVTVGDWENLERVREVIEQPRLVSFWDMRRFRSTGNLWLKSESPPVTDWPPDALVCGCLRVNRGTLTMAHMDGCSTVDELCARTGAGTMCGSCKPLLAELLGSRDSAPSSRHDSEISSSLRGRDSAPPSVLSRDLASLRGREGAPSSMRRRESSPATVRGRDLAPATVRGRDLAPPTMRGRDLASAPVRGRESTPTSLRRVERAPAPTWSGESTPTSLRRVERAPLSVLNPELGPASVRAQRRSITPPRDGVTCDRFTPTPVGITLFQSTQPGAPPTVSPSAVPPAAPSIPVPPASFAGGPDSKESNGDDSGPLSRRGSLLPPAPGRRRPVRSVRPAANFAEASTTPLALESDNGTASVLAPASMRFSFRPPQRISFIADGDEEMHGPASLRLGSVRATSGSNELSVQRSPGQRDAAPTPRRSILPPEPAATTQRKDDSHQPPPESSAPHSVRDLLAHAARGSVSLRRKDSPHLLLEMANLLGDFEKGGESALHHDASKERDAEPHDAERDVLGRSEWPLSMRSPTLSPARRRDSLPPLRPLSVGPPRVLTISSPPVVPGRLTVAPPEERGRRRLLAAAITSFTLVMAMAMLGPLPGARSVQGSHLDALWTTSVGKQVTGYSVVVLGLASMLLSLRKRWKRFAYSDVPIFRVVHGALASLALIMLGLHTGLHLGANLNRLLMIDFLALSQLGAVTASVTALSHWWSPSTAQNRRLVSSQAHLMLFWPLPVLLALHILGAYFY